MSKSLVSHLSDRLTCFIFRNQTYKPCDFKKGDKIVILSRDIDSCLNGNKYKPGMIGYIDNIMHRYKGQPAEHIEYWAVIYDEGEPIGRSRWEMTDILLYSTAMEMFKNQTSSQSSNET